MPEVDRRSYDERQMDTVLRACRSCLRAFYMKPWRVECLECAPHEYGTLRSERGDHRYMDLGGNPIWPDP